jgi:hypothetical protein
MAILSSLKRWVKSKPVMKRTALLAMRVAPSFEPRSVIHYPRFVRDWVRFRRDGGRAGLADLYPCLRDRTATTDVDPHYFYQAAWAATHILRSNARRHVDVGSHVLFAGMLTAFTEVTFVDIRPANVSLANFIMQEGTIVDLPFESNSIESLSSLHVIEHVGLGRYGDPIGAAGADTAARELTRVLATNGKLYLSTPIGRPRVQFNSQRIFSVDEVLCMFRSCRLDEFSIVDSAGVFRSRVATNASVEVAGSGNDFGLGMFLFRKDS